MRFIAFMFAIIIVTASGNAFAQSCALDSDCVGSNVCRQQVCMSKDSVPKEPSSQCALNADCGPGNICESGICKIPKRATKDEGAFSQCGNDRRCRIDRLKRKNNARRHSKQLAIERQVRREIAAQQAIKLKQTPRIGAPWTAGLQLSRLGPLPGVYVGYTMDGWLRFTGDYQFSEFDSFTSTGDLSAEIHWLTGAIEYLVLKDAFAPYVRAGFRYGTGDLDNFSFAVGGFSATTEAEIHALEIGAGFDMQFDFGLHAKLGLAYRPLIYSQASISPGNYNPSAKEGLDELYSDSVVFDVIGALGWAF